LFATLSLKSQQGRQCTRKPNIQALSRNDCCRGRAAIIKYYECVYSLSYPDDTCAALYCHLWPVWLYHISPHYFINGTIFVNKHMLNFILCFNLLYNMSEKFPSLIRNERDFVMTVHMYSCKVPLFLLDLNEH